MRTNKAREATLPVAVFMVWTLYVWVTRISNALGDATLSRASRTFSVVLALTFVVQAVAATVAIFWSRARARPGSGRKLVKALAVWTVVVWVIRVPMILADSHDVGFKAVHAALGLISVALAAWAWRAVRARGEHR